MCIIAIKKKGVDLPNDQTIKTMFENNSHGAGFMYTYKKAVHIEKGFMTVDDFINRLHELDKTLDLKNLALVLHFRITTHGGTSQANTHPFTISDKADKLKELELITDLGVAHNGVIDIQRPDHSISDTMRYIQVVLNPLKRLDNQFYLKNDIVELLEATAKSKLTFLDCDGNIKYIGDFNTDKTTGMIYSNYSWDKPKTSKYSYKYNYTKCLPIDDYESEYLSCEPYNNEYIYRDNLVPLSNQYPGAYIEYYNGEIDNILHDYWIDSDYNAYIYSPYHNCVLYCEAVAKGVTYNESESVEVMIDYNNSIESPGDLFKGIWKGDN